MAETTAFTLEGDVTLTYVSDSMESRGVVVVDSDGERMGLEEYVARQLGFPDDAEFDAMMSRLNSLRDQGLQPSDGEPDVTREGVKLRISVEVLPDSD